MSLPGNTKPLNESCSCEWCLHEHSKDVPAVINLCTEADSMGAEWTPICQDCLDEHKSNKHPEGNIGDCDWCHTVDIRVLPMRDYEEGNHGPVYDVCKSCRDKYKKRVQEELEASGYYDD